METAEATLKNLRQSPRKVRLVADYVRGKGAKAALDGLRYVDKRASAPLTKLIQSAIANAKNLDLDVEQLFVKEITVNSGAILYRRRPGTRGRAMPIRKRTSVVKVVLGQKAVNKNSKVKGDSAKTAKTESAQTVKKASKPRKAAKKNES